MTLPFNNQVTLITGAGSGIGRELALQMSRLGAIIAAVDLHPEPLVSLIEKLKAENGAGGWAVADVTDRAALKQAAATLTKSLGPIEILIANAGIGIENPAATFDAEIFARMIGVNLQGVANSVEAVLPGMVERRRGHLVAICSLASYRGMPLMAGYCASKAGVAALMDSLRFELKSRGIVCTTICPGWIRTALTRNIRFPKPTMLELDVAVRRMVDTIRRRKPYIAFPTGDRMMLAFQRLLPTTWGDWIVRQYARTMDKREKRPASTPHA